ncbi:DUF3135 domain-containing protein [Aquisalimonas asiatica]|uniref:DUF3135 domain-containing protein n=1 Tax=Aquisalimonas asiatica TaxID=406100 RepID=A0A1H8TGP7_9GAMM|nr:DUF3135 domain-containing protein [Aquisalimonas asiatica]SEO89966.1 Protein of unknown function [Aquisalimonas asiatica]
MTETRLTPPDFDEWRDLAVRDPDAFEHRRRALINATIEDAPPERRGRLRRLQWRIDTVRARQRDPLSACAALSRMMWQSVRGDQGLLNQVAYLHARWTGSAMREPPRARVLPFTRPGERPGAGND